jgi:hypothetical protein
MHATPLVAWKQEDTFRIHKMIYCTNDTFFVKYETFWKSQEDMKRSYINLQTRNIWVKAVVVSTDESTDQMVVKFPAILESHSVNRNSYPKEAGAKSVIPSSGKELSLEMFLSFEKKLALSRIDAMFSELSILKSNGIKVEKPKDSLKGRDFSSSRARSKRLARFLPSTLNSKNPEPKKERLRLELHQSLSVASSLDDFSKQFSRFLVRAASSIFRSLRRKLDSPDVTVMFRVDPVMIEKGVVKYCTIMGWEMQQVGRGEFLITTNSRDVLQNSLGSKTHTASFLDPLVRYYFSSEDLFEMAKQFAGIEADILCDPLNLSIPKGVYEQKARNELGSSLPADAASKWSKSRIRDAVLQYRITNNHSIGVKALLSVVVSEVDTFCVKIRPGGPLGSVIQMSFRVTKETLKLKPQGIVSRVVF